MAQAGPSNPPNHKKNARTKAPLLKSKKVKKVAEAQAIANLEQAAQSFVSNPGMRCACIMLINTAYAGVGTYTRPQAIRRPSHF